uniref:Dynamin N-terminal domain-containing protein n=1 Tax=Eutreptiella gymnastica TaxID=73025 RepID=A0A7S1I2X2_9EUGL|mmetsp:Transcript_124983/g.216691  ORF Transcript_124983/g.216691 Transcript_124983/m.216691 type:complete len:1355 (+) Transcript_124983:102-4166(+)
MQAEQENARKTIQKLVARMNNSLQEVEPVRLLVTVLREALKDKLQSDRSLLFNALFSELLSNEASWGDWKGEKFPAQILNAWASLTRRKVFDSAIPPAGQMNEDDMEPILIDLVKMLDAVDEPGNPSYPQQMELLVAKWKLRRTKDKDKVRVAVVGVESCGKSTMVNHLIGTQALPTAAGMGTNSVMFVRNCPRTAVTMDDGEPEYPSNLQELLKQKLETPANEVLKIETPWTHSLGNVDMMDVPGLKVSKNSFSFQDNTAKHSAIAMAMCDIVVVCARDAETLQGQLNNANLLKTLPKMVGEKPVICAVTRSEPTKFEEQRGELVAILKENFPDSVATEVVFANMMFAEFREGRENLTQLFKMKPRRPDINKIWDEVYRTVLKSVRSIRTKFEPIERAFERQFNPVWGEFKDQLNLLYTSSDGEDSEEAEREELRKIMVKALAETGFEEELNATVSRMKPLQLSLFKTQDDTMPGATQIRWNLIGDMRKAVFNAIDFLGYELWRRYILKGLELLVDSCNVTNNHDKIIVNLAHKILEFDSNRAQTLQEKDLYGTNSSIVDLCDSKTFRNLFTGFYFVLLDPPCAYDIMEYTPGGKAYWKAYVEPCQALFTDFSGGKYPDAVSQIIHRDAEDAFPTMRSQLLKEMSNITTFLLQCPVFPKKDVSGNDYSNMMMYVILHIFIGFLYRSVCDNIGENSAALSELGLTLQQKACETPFALSLQALRDAPQAEDKASVIREFYQTCRGVITTLMNGKRAEENRVSLESIKKVLDDVGNLCDLLFDPSRKPASSKVLLFSPCASRTEKGRNMDTEIAIKNLMEAYMDNPNTSLVLVQDGDDAPTGEYCAAVIVRSTYDRDTADMSAREKDILKGIESWGNIARVFVLMGDEPDDNVSTYLRAPPMKDDPYRRVRRLIITPEMCKEVKMDSRPAAPTVIPEYIKLTVQSVQIIDPQVLPSDDIALVIKTDSPEFLEAFPNGMKASKENPSSAGGFLTVEWNIDYVLPIHGGSNHLMVELTLIRAGAGHVTFGVFETILGLDQINAMSNGRGFQGKMLRGGATVGYLRVDMHLIVDEDLDQVAELRPKKGRAEEWVKKALVKSNGGPPRDLPEDGPIGNFIGEFYRIQAEGAGPRIVKQNMSTLKTAACERLEEVALRLDSREFTQVGPDLRGRTIEECIFDSYSDALDDMDAKAKTIKCAMMDQMPKWFQFTEAHIDKIVEKTPVIAGVRLSGFPELWARMHCLVYSEVALVHLAETMSRECWRVLFEPRLEQMADLFGIEKHLLLEELMKSKEQRIRVLVDESAFVAMCVGFVMMFSITYVAWQVFAKFNTPETSYKSEFHKIHRDANSRFSKLFDAPK